jgi:hypothetical protein
VDSEIKHSIAILLADRIEYKQERETDRIEDKRALEERERRENERFGEERADREAERKERHAAMAAAKRFYVTPSKAVGSASDAFGPIEFRNMMEALNLEYPDVDDEEQESLRTDISFKWRNAAPGSKETNEKKAIDKAKEITSYVPIVEYLKNEWGLDAYVVGNGENCANGKLLQVQVFTQRLTLDNLEKCVVDYRGTIEGNTDVIVTTRPLNNQHWRHCVRFAVEVKTVAAMNSDSAKRAFLREVITQSCGFNIYNRNRAVPIILTNLHKSHSVIYLEQAATAPRLRYRLRERICKNFAAAVAFAAQNSKERPDFMTHFGRPTSASAPIVEESEGAADSDSEEEDAWAEEVSADNRKVAALTEELDVVDISNRGKV